MQIWITHYALTKGIQQFDGKPTSTEGMVQVKLGDYTSYFHKPHWHINKEDAADQAKKMKDAKLKSLKKQIERIEKLNFS